MPNTEQIYNTVIQQSQANVKALSEKLKALDKLHQDIIKLKDDNSKLPKIFDDKFNEISELSKNYTENLGKSTKTYLDGNNTLFTSKINDLSSKIKEIENEITRLVETDFNSLFKILQNAFIEQARKDIKIELIKFDDKAKVIQTKINSFQEKINEFQQKNSELKTEVTRLENVDLEKHFDKLQKTLSDIFNAINSLNTSFTTVIQTLNSIVQSVGNIQMKIESNHNENQQTIKTFYEKTTNHLNEQDIEITKNREIFENRIEKLEIQNENISKKIKTNKLIGIIGIGIIITLLIIQFFIK